MATVRDRSDFLVLQSCAELRIPMVLFVQNSWDEIASAFPDEKEKVLADSLLGIALAKYDVSDFGDSSHPNPQTETALVEFADALLVFSKGDTGACAIRIASDARELGIPTKTIGFDRGNSSWSFGPELNRPARHGFETRKELLEFFDARYRPGTRGL